MSSTGSHAGGSGPLYPQTPEANAAADEPVVIPGRDDEAPEAGDEAPAEPDPA